MRGILIVLKKLHHVALAAVLASVPVLTSGQTTRPDDQPSDDPIVRRQQSAAKAELALSFLQSPDSGVWSGPNDTFTNAAATFDALGGLQARFLRFHQGLQVLGAGVKVTVAPDGQVTFNYPPRPFVPPASIVPAITESRAWRLVAREMKIDQEGLFGDLDLVLLAPDTAKPAVLAWRAHAFHPAAAPEKFYLDATTGAVIHRGKGVAEEVIESKGIGTKTNDDVVLLDTRFDTTRELFHLIDLTRGGTEVSDMHDSHSTPDHHGDVYSDENNVWGNGEDWEYGDSTTGETGQTAAVDVLWGAQRTWDTLLNVFSLDGYNGAGEPMKLRVHYRQEEGVPYANANFDDFFANFGDGETSEDSSWTDFWIVAHELGHGVWTRQIAMDSEGEARGLNEGHGDITAAVVMHYAYLADGAGGVVPTNAPGTMDYFLERMVNPWKYNGLAGYVPYMKEVEEHAQGTAYGHMFAILAMGAPSQVEFDASPCVDKSYTCLAKSPFPLGMVGIGMQKAAQIWFLATVKYFDEHPSFPEAREAWLSAAEELFGNPSPEHSAVQNAFYAINVGYRAVDLGPPEVWTNPLIVDNAEKTVLVDIQSTDDIGVVRLDIALPSDGGKVQGSEFFGYFKAPMIPGDYNAQVRAYDAGGDWSEINPPFAYAGANHLIHSTFDGLSYIEDGVYGLGGWVVDEQAMVRTNDADGSFLGDGYISFSGDDSIEREVSIPSEATQIHLGYRYRVQPGLAFTNGELRVEILDHDGNVLETLEIIPADDDTTQAYSNDYRKHVKVPAASYAGQTIKVRFRVGTDVQDAFRLDQVYLVYDAVPAADLAVEVDETEGSVIFTSQVTGIAHHRVDYVGLEVDGAEVTQNHYWPYQALFSTAEFQPDVLMPAEANVYDHFGTQVADSAEEWFKVRTINKRIVNGGFESGSASWSLTGAVAECNDNPAAGEGSPAFIGTGCMLFTGEGTLSQNFSIPGTALSAKVSMRVKSQSAVTEDVVLKVKVYNNANGQWLGLLGEVTGEENTASGTSHNGYEKFVYNLTPYKGMNLKLKFEVENPTGQEVVYFLDNIGASYTVYLAPGGGVLQQ